MNKKTKSKVLLFVFTISILFLLLNANNTLAYQDDDDLKVTLHCRLESDGSEIQSVILPTGNYDFFEEPKLDVGDYTHDLSRFDVEDIQNYTQNSVGEQDFLFEDGVNATQGNHDINFIHTLPEYEVGAGFDTRIDVGIEYVMSSHTPISIFNDTIEEGWSLYDYPNENKTYSEIFYVTNDAYTKSSSGGSNYGSSTELRVSHFWNEYIPGPGGEWLDQYTYIDIGRSQGSYLSDNETKSSELWIYAQSYLIQPTGIYVYETTVFDESTITWNNQPASGIHIGTYNPPESSWFYISIGTEYGDYYTFRPTNTNYVREFDSSESARTPYVYHYYSKEYQGNESAYMQANQTETLTFRGGEYDEVIHISDGRLEVELQTTTDKELRIHLLKDGVVVKDVQLLASGNSEFGIQNLTVQIPQQTIDFNQIEVEGELDDTHYVKLFNIEVFSYESKDVLDGIIIEDFTYQILGVDKIHNLTLIRDNYSTDYVDFNGTYTYFVDSSSFSYYNYTYDVVVIEQNLTLVMSLSQDLNMDMNFTVNVNYSTSDWRVPSEVNFEINGVDVMDEGYNSGYMSTEVYSETISFTSTEGLLFRFESVSYFQFSFDLEIISKTYMKRVFTLLSDHNIIIERIDFPENLEIKKIYLNDVDLGSENPNYLNPEFTMSPGNIYSIELILADNIYNELPHVDGDDYKTIYSEYFNALTGEMSHAYYPDNYNSSYHVNGILEMINTFPEEYREEIWNDWVMYYDTEYTSSNFSLGDFSSRLKVYNSTILPLASREYYGSPDNFNDDLGKIGTDIAWVDYISANSDVEIIATIGSHQNVLEVKRDGVNSDVWHYFSSENAGSREFWVRTTDVIQRTRLYFWEDWTDPLIQFKIEYSQFQYQTNGKWSSIVNVENDVWYHVKIDWRADNKYDIYIDEIKMANDVAMDGVQTSGINRFEILTVFIGNNHVSYLDAWGNKDDPNYNEGDNRIFYTKSGSFNDPHGDLNSIDGNYSIFQSSDSGFFEGTHSFIGLENNSYHGNYSFDNDINGVDPAEWTVYEGIGGTVNVINGWENHSKVVNLHSDGTGSTGESNLFTHNKFSNQTTGAIEFWIGVTANMSSHFTVYDDQSPTSRPGLDLSFFWNGTICYYVMGKGWSGLMLYTINTWYHFRIEFNCSEDHYHLWINNESMDGGSGILFQGDPVNMNTLGFVVYDSTVVYDYYIDAIDYSWTSGYYPNRNYRIKTSHGWYHGTPNNFNDEIIGTTGTDISFLNSYYSAASVGHVKIVENVSNHKNVLQVYDHSSAGTTQFYHDLSPVLSGTNIVFEFWYRTENNAQAFTFACKDHTSVDALSIDINGIANISDNTWYHFKFVLNTVNDNYSYYINGVLTVYNATFANTVGNIGRIFFATGWGDQACSHYIDAFAVNIEGRNINPYNIQSLLNEGWVLYGIDDAFNYSVNIEDKSGHSACLHMKGSDGGYYMNLDFVDSSGGTIEYWQYGNKFSGWDNDVDFGLVHIYIDGSNGRLAYYRNATYNGYLTSYDCSGQWNHIRIDIIPNSITSFYVNDVLELTLNTPSLPGFSYISIHQYSKEEEMWIDGIGFSWDPDYDIGDNLYDCKLTFTTTVNLNDLIAINDGLENTLETREIKYSFKTTQSQLFNMSIYNFDTLDFELINSSNNYNNFYELSFIINLSCHLDGYNNTLLKFEGYNYTNAYELYLEELKIYFNWTKTGGNIFAHFENDVIYSFLNRYDGFSDYQKLYNVSISFSYTFTNYTSYDYLANCSIDNSNYSLGVDGNSHSLTHEFTFNSASRNNFTLLFNITNGLLEVSNLSYTTTFNCLDNRNKTRLYQKYIIDPVLALDYYEKTECNIYVNFTYDFTTSNRPEFDYYNEIGNALLVFVVNITTESTNIVGLYEYNETNSGEFTLNIREFLSNNSRGQLLDLSLGVYLIGNGSLLELDDLNVYRKYEKIQVDKSPRTDVDSVGFLDYLVASRSFSYWYFDNSYDMNSVDLTNLRTSETITEFETEVNSSRYYFHKSAQEDDVFSSSLDYNPNWDVSVEVVENTGIYTKLKITYKADMAIKNVTIVIDVSSYFNDEWTLNATQNSQTYQLEIPWNDFSTISKVLYVEGYSDTPYATIYDYESDQNWNRLAEDTEIKFAGFLKYPKYTRDFLLNVNETWNCYNVYYGNETYSLVNVSKSRLYISGEGFNPNVNDSYLYFKAKPFVTADWDWDETNHKITITIESELAVDYVYFVYEFDPTGVHDLELLNSTNDFTLYNLSDSELDGHLTFHSFKIKRGTTVIVINVNFATPMEMFLQTIIIAIVGCAFVGIYYYFKSDEKRLKLIQKLIDEKIISKIEKIKKEHKGLESAVIEIKDNKLFIKPKG